MEDAPHRQFTLKTQASLFINQSINDHEPSKNEQLTQAPVPEGRRSKKQIL
jgi:hypothetical protein